MLKYMILQKMVQVSVLGSVGHLARLLLEDRDSISPSLRRVRIFFFPKMPRHNSFLKMMEDPISEL